MKLAAYVQRISLEDAEGEAKVDLPQEEVPSVQPEEIENIDEMLDIEPEEDGVTAELKEAEDIQESLEHFKVLLIGAQSRGGLRPEEGMMFQAAMEHFNKRLGVETRTLGLEDFGGTMSRREATDVSMESLKDNLKAAGKKIIELVKKLLSKIKESMEKFKNMSGVSKKVSEASLAIGKQIKSEGTVKQFEVASKLEQDQANAMTIQKVIQSLGKVKDFLRQHVQWTKSMSQAAAKVNAGQMSEADYIALCNETSPFKVFPEIEETDMTVMLGLGVKRYENKAHGDVLFVGSVSKKDTKGVNTLKVSVDDFMKMADALPKLSDVMSDLKETAANTFGEKGALGVALQLSERAESSAGAEVAHRMVVQCGSTVDIMFIAMDVILGDYTRLINECRKQAETAGKDDK